MSPFATLPSRLLLGTWLVATAALPSALIASEKHAAGHHGNEGLAGTQSLDIAAQGNTLDLFIGTYASGEPRARLEHLRSLDGGGTWSKPTQVDAGLTQAHMPHRGMDAQIAASGEKLVAAWMTPGTDRFGGGPMATALSADGGKTWTAGPNPADDGSTTGHGFIDMASGPAGTFHLTWFDTRGEQRGLRYSRSTDAGKTWSANETPDADTCECCWNAIAAGPDGKVAILYRDKSPRDMSLVELPGAEGAKTWTKPATVGNFDWQFEGCPHVGGGLAMGGPSAGAALHAAVWTGQPDRVGVYYLNQGLASGTKWKEPVRLGDSSASHPDVAVAGSQVAAVWNAKQGDAAVIKGAVSTDGGSTWGEPIVLSDPVFSATHGRVVGTEAGFRVFWTQSHGDHPAAWTSKTLTAPTLSKR
ncbi:sialidase family protein [Verrucomicrobium sp. BvORR034]|uniref:sialidase family protein n=1 Tax=Verrucomicrobium sp. BvORR034 TaxID=1396418 RepID=UPI000678954E|nr:sialidase family protein [Verrucomicrobium sp. BvORR034]